MTWLSDCYKKPPPNYLEIDGEPIGISGMAEVMEKALDNLDAPEQEIDNILLAELKARNYVPPSEEGSYLKALKKEFIQLSARRREEVEDVYQGIPREKIPWYPKVDGARCEGCSSCVEFCSQSVFEFFDGKSHVVRPYNCIVGKASCRAFCPDNAISFPTRAELKDTLAELKDKH
ncbi:TPA: ferredoxin family protein [Thermoplasmata archaeon]|nr:ferredoxin family protein [Thermoplasmata archaeon]